jgi:hypothetical protein
MRVVEDVDVAFLRSPWSAALSITAFTAKDITPTKIGRPVLPCTSVSPVSAW